MLYKFTFISGRERVYRIEHEQHVDFRIAIASSHRFFRFTGSDGYDVLINLDNVAMIEEMDHA